VGRHGRQDGPAKPGPWKDDMVEIYKRGQGKYTRLLTLGGAVLIALVAAAALSQFLRGYDQTRAPLISFGVPTLLVLAIGVWVLWLINRPKAADFLIATEGEMKKVSWSSRKEIVGSTKVVIVTTFIMALVLFGVDLLFIFLFRWTGVSV
jgi:preprotein translocase subunit SecE